MNSIAQNLQNISLQIPENVKLIAVSKLKPSEDILEAYHAGHRRFGENKAQEMKGKQEILPPDIEWHFIGHLQRNKVKYIAPYVHLIHSVDSPKLLQEINRQAERNNRIINCLLQFYIATEESKFGFSPEEACEFLNDSSFQKMHNIRICGVMGMATYTENKALMRQEFNTLHSYYSELKKKYFADKSFFKEISMGMTNDFSIAIEEGIPMACVSVVLSSENEIAKLPKSTSE